MTESIQPRDDKNDWMVVFATHILQEAHIVAGRLKSEDIPAFVEYEPGASAIGISIGNLGEKRVVVEQQFYEKAMALLYPDEPVEIPESTDKIRYIWDEDNDDAD